MQQLNPNSSNNCPTGDDIGKPTRNALHRTFDRERNSRSSRPAGIHHRRACTGGPPGTDGCEADGSIQCAGLGKNHRTIKRQEK
jgi:hypothetical protein